MARIVLGLGTSHGPQMTTPAEEWPEDGSRFLHYGLTLHSVPDGAVTDFHSLVSTRSAAMVAEITKEKIAMRSSEVEDGIRFIEKTIVDANPDVLVMIGDDQKELFLDNQISVFGVFCGARYPIVRVQRERSISHFPAYSWEDDHEFEAHEELAHHIVRELCAHDFDVMRSSEVPAGRSMSHPFAFVHKTILKGRPVRSLPIWINTYYDPNRPSPRRCINFGRAVRRAIEQWPGDERVAVMASGGLSHFTVDEELDRNIIDAMEKNELERLYDIPLQRMQSGTSEWLLWFAAAGALEDLALREMRYIPGYRTPAGTGCGIGFARWE